jgi:hypothetical protein
VVLGRKVEDMGVLKRVSISEREGYEWVLRGSLTACLGMGMGRSVMLAHKQGLVLVQRTETASSASQVKPCSRKMHIQKMGGENTTMKITVN